MKETAPATDRLVTIPNLLCVIRLLGSIVLIVLALHRKPEAFLWLFLGLAMTDWVDGKLAILLNQRSVFGARLDSWADAALYAALLFGALLMHWQQLSGEIFWIAPAVLSYIVSTLAGFARYRRWPSYHTRAAKASWFLVTVAAVCLLGGWALWPLRASMLAVTLTNIEAILITWRSKRWLTDVTSIFHLEKASDPDDSL